MDQDSTNEGDFSIIELLGSKKPVANSKAPSKPEPVPTRTEADDEDLEALQRAYLWACTFREI